MLTARNVNYVRIKTFPVLSKSDVEHLESKVGVFVRRSWALSRVYCVQSWRNRDWDPYIYRRGDLSHMNGKLKHILQETSADKLTHSLMELGPSWEAANCAATRELPSILYNPEVHHRVHMAPHRSLSWARSIQSLPSHPASLRSIIILSTHLRLGLPSGSLLLAFPPISYMHSSPPFVLHALPISSSLTWSL
jgi:hypothetical protein